VRLGRGRFGNGKLRRMRRERGKGKGKGALALDWGLVLYYAVSFGHLLSRLVIWFKRTSMSKSIYTTIPLISSSKVTRRLRAQFTTLATNPLVYYPKHKPTGPLVCVRHRELPCSL
jgi:hypothetical protein